MKTIYSIFITLSLLVSVSAFATSNNETPATVSINNIKINFDATRGANMLTWETPNFSDVNYFLVEKTVNGTDYTVAGYVFAGEVSSYHFKTDNSTAVEYKITAVSKTDAVLSTSSLKIAKN